jgi:hypothetical protein
MRNGTHKRNILQTFTKLSLTPEIIMPIATRLADGEEAGEKVGPGDSGQGLKS